VNPDLVINVTCVSAVDKQRSKLSVWIRWRLPPTNVMQWHSFIEVINERRGHLDYIAETDTNHKRLDLAADQLFDIRVSLVFFAWCTIDSVVLAQYIYCFCASVYFILY